MSFLYLCYNHLCMLLCCPSLNLLEKQQAPCCLHFLSRSAVFLPLSQLLKWYPQSSFLMINTWQFELSYLCPLKTAAVSQWECTLMHWCNLQTYFLHVQIRIVLKTESCCRKRGRGLVSSEAKWFDSRASWLRLKLWVSCSVSILHCW